MASGFIYSFHFFFLVFSALVIFLVLGQNSQEKSLKEGEICLACSLRDAVHTVGKAW